MPSGFAHLRFSILPVLGQRISCQDTGSIVEPACAEYQQRANVRQTSTFTSFTRRKYHTQVIPGSGHIVAPRISQRQLKRDI